MPISGIGPKQIPLPAAKEPQAGMKAPQVSEEQKLRKVAKDFEAIFMGQLVQVMGKTLPEGSMASGGMANMMFDRVMGEALSEGGGIGLAEIIYRDLLSKDVSENSEKGSMTSLQNLIMPNARKEIDVKSSSE